MRKRILKMICTVEMCTLLVGMCGSYRYATAYKCGYNDPSTGAVDGYVCCSSYHTWGHERYLMTMDGNKSGPRYYKIGSGFNESQKKSIHHVVNLWNQALRTASANGHFYLIESSSNPQIKIETHTLDAGMIGYTNIYKKDGSVEAPDSKGRLASKYATCLIYIDTEKGRMNRSIGHELGHAMGLSHRLCDDESIMFNFMETIKVTAAQNVDADVVYHVYCG